MRMDNLSYLGAVTGSAGRWLLSPLNRVIDQLAFMWVCLKLMVRYRAYGRRLMQRILVQQIYFTGVQSLELIGLLAMLIGALVVLQGISQLNKLGSIDDLSVLIIVILVRELGPLLTAVIVILRSGSAIAMEIGYMRVLGELEGLEMQGISTMHFLGIPRLIGVATSVVCLMIVFDMVSVAGGFFAAWVIEDISVGTFLNNIAASLTFSDFVVVALKGLCFGLVIPVVCMYHGFMAEKAITNVPPRVSRALVDCLIYCVMFNIAITAAFLA
jgi:phospholipid/cholesterol/gamma-HCH transport system permease protein